MGWTCENKGDGRWEIKDDGVETNQPFVNFNGTITSNPQLTQDFGRIANNQFNSNEEVRYYRTSPLANGYALIGVAQSGSSIDAAVWSIIQEFFDTNGKPVRDIFIANAIWSNLAVG